MDRLDKNMAAPDGFIINRGANSRGDELSLRKILGVIGKHKATLFITMLMGLLLAYLALNLISNKYNSEALLLIESQNSRVVKFDEVVASVPVDVESLQSQVRIIGSREEALKAIVTLGLHKKAEFLKVSKSLPFLPERRESPAEPYRLTYTGKAVEIPAQVYHYFEKNLSVSRQSNSRIISISFTSKDPDVSADVVNLLAEQYIQSTVNRKIEGTNLARNLLEKEVKLLKENVFNAEQQIQQFRAQHGLTDTVGTAYLGTQISQINSQLILVRAERVEAQARYDQVRKRGTNAGNVSAIEVLQSPVVQRLREQQLNLQRSFSDLAQEYGMKHPKMIALQSQLRSITRNISAETQRIVRGIRDQVDIKRAQETSLENSLLALKSKVGASNEKSVELQALEREAESSNAVLAAFLSRVKETGAKTDPKFYEPDAVLISKGFPAYESLLPKPLPVLILAGIGSLLLGLILVFLKESIENTPNEIDEPVATEPVLRPPQRIANDNVVPMKSLARNQSAVAAFTSETVIVREGKNQAGIVNVVGTVPVFSMGFGDRVATATFTKARPDSPFSQALLKGLSAFMGRGVVRSIMVTGSDKSVARTSIAVSVAALLARTGQRVVIVDMDFMKPSLHQAFEASNQFGVIDYLDRKRSLSALIQVEKNSGVNFIPAGRYTSTSTGNLSLEILASVTKVLQTEYDIVILLGGAFLVSEETRELGTKVDRLIYVLPEKLKQNRKILAEIIKTAKSNRQDAGVVYTR